MAKHPRQSAPTPTEAQPRPATSTPPTPAPLSDAQRDAVEHTGGPLIVLAGPGTGKTRVIIHRIAHQIESGIAEPEEIVAVTYTVKATQQLRDRLAALLGGTLADRVHIHTFHGLGSKILRRFPDFAGLPGEFSLLDEAQQRRTLRELILKHNLFPESAGLGTDALLNEAADTMSAFANLAVDDAKLRSAATAWQTRIDAPEMDPETRDAELSRLDRFRGMSRLAALYTELRRKRGWMTMDDLIVRAIHLLDEQPRVAAIVRDEWRHVVVDEFQDVNPAQIELLARLAPPVPTRDIAVVGDDDQAIYAFRGASELAFEVFRRRWDGARVVTLAENHRSAPRIVAAANHVISHAIHRFDAAKIIQVPESKRGDTGTVETVRMSGEQNDAELIPAMILADRTRRADAVWSDYAVIARGHNDLDRVAGGLELRGVPFARRPKAWFHDDAVQDVLAWITVLAEPEPAERFAAAQRLLRRPPTSTEPATVIEWRQTFRAENARAEIDADHPLPERDFIEWLSHRYAVVPAIGALHARLRELTTFAAANTAADAIARIITLTGVAHTEMLEPRERAARVRNLVRLMRVAAARQPRLDPPGDLFAFWAYGKDFSAKTGPLGESLDESVDPDADEQPVGEGVQLITAHSAKGLEFHTVFVPRAGGGHGFSKSSRDDGPYLPPELVRFEGDTRSDSERRADEARRLFYVACTRAERRLVVLSKKNKKRSPGLNLFEELDLDAPAGVGLSRLEEDGVHADAARAAGQGEAIIAGDASLRAQTSLPLEQRNRVIDELRREARILAGHTLDQSQHPALAAADLERASDSLRVAAGLLAIAESAARGEASPAWATDKHAPESWQIALERLHSAVALPTTPGAIVLTPPKPPLRLSYTRVQDYLTCPRCWYLKYVLSLTAPGSAAQSVGLVVHRSLERFFDATREAEAEGRTPPGLDDLLASALAMYFRGLGPTDAPDADLIRQLQAQLRGVHASLHRASDEILELERAVAFDFVHDGVTHKFDAKIDRIDRLPDGGIRIIDYKTGQPSKAKTEPKADDLQLGVYALAAAHLYETGDKPPLGVAEYWVLPTGERGTISLQDLRLDKVRTKVGEAIDGILSGDFAQGKKCRHGCELFFPGRSETDESDTHVE